MRVVFNTISPVYLENKQNSTLVSMQKINLRLGINDKSYIYVKHIQKSEICELWSEEERVEKQFIMIRDEFTNAIHMWI